jgi:hypothetical protein
MARKIIEHCHSGHMMRLDRREKVWRCTGIVKGKKCHHTKSWMQIGDVDIK